MLFCFLMQKDRFKLLIWSQVPFICSMQCHFMNSRHLKRMDFFFFFFFFFFSLFFFFFFFFFAAPNLKYVMHHCYLSYMKKDIAKIP